VKKILWLAVGIGVGFAVAHQVSKTEQGQRFFSDVDDKARGFASAVIDGYKAREAELRAAVKDASAALDELR
jgi:hypothetical protein